MFEFSIAIRYLLPRKFQKSLSFVGLFSSFVIAVVLWLLLVFVSITQSIEHQWLSKMTALSAPLRIKPTQSYFQSYYYQIDQYCEASNYKTKSFLEKLNALSSDPFNPELDESVSHLPMAHRNEDGTLVDPVKKLHTILQAHQKNQEFRFHEFALSAGALHLNLKNQGQTQTLNQVLYVSSYNPESLNQGKLIESWDKYDLNHLFRNASLNEKLWPLDAIIKDIKIHSITLEPFRIKAPLALKISQSKWKACAQRNAEGSLQKVMLVTQSDFTKIQQPQLEHGLFDFKDHTFNGNALKDDELYIDKLEDVTLEAIKSTPHGRVCLLKGQIGQKTYFFELSPQDFVIDRFEMSQHAAQKINQLFLKNPRSPYPILAPKSFKEQGAKIGDKGTISYGIKTLSGFQEMKTPVIVSGFYDPGLFSVGAKIILASRDFIELIGSSATTYALDPSETNGFFVFPKHFQDAKSLQSQLQIELANHEINSYFQIQSFDEYPFVKEILEQFVSDKLIFFLVGLIIFIVALSNVAFLMQLLVRDKSHDMAILRSLGASVKQVQNIFIISGLIMGFVSTLLAFFLCYLTLHFIQPILKALSFFFGQSVNLCQFYGIADHVSIDSTAALLALIFCPLLCALASFFATKHIRKKTVLEFLKEPR